MNEADEEFITLKVMPTSRLNDVLKALETKPITVLNLDACLPPKELGEMSLKTILFKFPTTLKVFSVRFNNLSAHSVEKLIEFIANNDHLEMLYFMGSGLDDKNRQLMEDAWKKKMVGHRSDNGGYTLIRVPLEQKLLAEQPPADS